MKNTIAVAIIALLIGGIVGYSIKPSEVGHMNPENMMDHSGMGTHTMGSMMMDMTQRMENKEGDELDRIFLEDMIVHHEGAVDMAVIIRDKTDKPELKAFAQEIIDAQSTEVDMMKKWLMEWF